MNVVICFNILGYNSGGVGTHIIDLCKQYAKMNEINKLFLLCDGGEHIPTLLTIPKVKYIKIPFNEYGMKPIGIIKLYKTVWNAIRDEKIDIIHVHSQRVLPAIFLIKKLHGIPYLWTNHIDAIPQPKIFKVMCHIMKFPIISVSNQLRNMMIGDYGCNPSTCFVVNNGTDLELLTKLTPEEKKELEKKYHIDRTNHPYVICLLSRVTYIKGHLFLLQAISKLSMKSKIKVIIAGHTYPENEEYKNQLNLFAKSNNINVEFLEYSKPRDVFGVSDMFVLPSLYEGFALVCIEALAMECAVIRSRTPGWEEMQDWLEVVEKQDVDGLAIKIEEVINNGFNRDKILAGANSVRTIFTKEECAKNTINIYKKVMAL